MDELFSRQALAPRRRACGDAIIPALIPAWEILNAVRVKLRDLADARRVHLDFRMGTGAVCGDECRLAEALESLVRHAIESCSSGGFVIVVSRLTADGGQEWMVHDSGPGLVLQLLSWVGVPDLSHHRRSRRVAIARDIFRSQGGLLRVESASVWGTLVSVSLPGREDLVP